MIDNKPFEYIKYLEQSSAQDINPYKYSESTKEFLDDDIKLIKNDHICFLFIESGIEHVFKTFSYEDIIIQHEHAYKMFNKYREIKDTYKFESYMHNVRDIEHNIDLMLSGPYVGKFTLKSSYIQTIANLDNLLNRLCYHLGLLAMIINSRQQYENINQN